MELDEGYAVEGVPDGEQEDEEEAQRRVEARAESILDSLEESFPNECIRRRLADSDDVGPAARTLLTRVSSHDFHRESIRERASADPSLLEGIEDSEAERALEEVEAVERVSRFTDRADEVAALVGTGMDSAMAIGSMPKRQFVDLYDEALGGRAQAARVHAQAQQTARHAGGALLLHRCSRCRARRTAGAGRQGRLDARTPFQAVVLRCEHCGSVYSPAAYFVDLLR